MKSNPPIGAANAVATPAAVPMAVKSRWSYIPPRFQSKSLPTNMMTKRSLPWVGSTTKTQDCKPYKWAKLTPKHLASVWHSLHHFESNRHTFCPSKLIGCHHHPKDLTKFLIPSHQDLLQQHLHHEQKGLLFQLLNLMILRKLSRIASRRVSLIAGALWCAPHWGKSSTLGFHFQQLAARTWTRRVTQMSPRLSNGLSSLWQRRKQTIFLLLEVSTDLNVRNQCPSNTSQKAWYTHKTKKRSPETLSWFINWMDCPIILPVVQTLPMQWNCFMIKPYEIKTWSWWSRPCDKPTTSIAQSTRKATTPIVKPIIPIKTAKINGWHGYAIV